MPKVDFYVLKDATAKLPFVCKLLDKAYSQKQKVYVHAGDQAEAHALDEQLWTFRDNSFIPHNLTTEAIQPPPPIQIGYDASKAARHPILVNLSKNILDNYQQYARIIEIVSDDNKEIAREHFKFYRENQCELTTYNL